MKSEVIICGAGIAGVSAAYFLSARCGIGDILLVDDQPALSLTTDHSTECYRNWWPGPGEAMVGLMNRSIDLLEELAEQSGNAFNLNRRGYLYCTSQQAEIESMQRNSEQISCLGAGELRVHYSNSADPVYSPADPEGFHNQPDGADLLVGSEVVHKHFPFLAEDIVSALHVRRAGWLSAQQLGMYLLQQARQGGVKLVSGRVSQVNTNGERISGAILTDGTWLEAPIFINAAGPFLGQVGSLLGVELPVYNELHLKCAMHDPLGVVDRHAPLLILNDPQKLSWTSEERSYLEEDQATHYLLEELPAGIHTRPEGGTGSDIILVLWEYITREMEPCWPIFEDPLYVDVALRGLSRLLPGVQAYINKAAKPRLDGGYYTKTHENRPLIGRLPVEGAFIIGALSGYGIMASCAAGELLAKYVSGKELPGYASAFDLKRYQDAEYLHTLETWDHSGQL